MLDFIHKLLEAIEELYDFGKEVKEETRDAYIDIDRAIDKIDTIMDSLDGALTEDKVRDIKYDLDDAIDSLREGLRTIDQVHDTAHAITHVDYQSEFEILQAKESINP